VKQVVQSVRDGALRVIDLPVPSIGPTEVLVATERSLVSAGTERAVRRLAGASLLAKARARPDLVRQVLRRARSEGLRATAGAVQQRLDEDMPLGYSAVGVVEQVGEAVAGLHPGMRVATGGAPHAGYQSVAGLLAVPVPDRVSDTEAACATVAAIALQGIRLAELGPGARVCVVGLGLVGQLAVRLARASGCEVAGIDVRPWVVARAAGSGAHALVESGADTTEAIVDWSRGRGVDAVLLCAATPSSDPIRRAPDLVRDRGTLVVVGDIGLELDRTPLYEKELTLRVARSYGPGRYDRTYEDYAVDYPVGQVRWSEGRNIEAVLDLLASGRASFADLVTHELPIERASDAYALLESDAPCLGVQLTYDAGARDRRPAIDLRRDGTVGAPAGLPSPPRVAVLGAGTFVRATLLPAMTKAGFDRRVAIASAGGVSARLVGERNGFERVVADADAVGALDDVDLVLVATPHDTHARLASMFLRASRHVFCEKPLALSHAELDEVVDAWRDSPAHLAVGFNRRHAPAIGLVKEALGASGGPLVMEYRVSAGRLPASHWYHDRRQGGRLLGEVCHFIDTCNAIVGAPPVRVAAMGGHGIEALLADDVTVQLGYPDGSLASISYGSRGHPSTFKERLEVLGRGHTAVVDDFRSVVVDGRSTRLEGHDKGHVAELLAVRTLVEHGHDTLEAALTVTALETTAATLAAAESLLTGRVVVPRVVEARTA
jgi:predicted dehydrogenase/threonine dehydrogenase-like Zn-dependent dehydrogenase